MTDVHTFTIVAAPADIRLMAVYEPLRTHHNGRERYTIILINERLLPEEVANEIMPARDGSVWMTSVQPPAVEHPGGWTVLECELRRCAAENRPKDGLFSDQVVEITFDMVTLPLRPNSPYSTPLTILSPTKVRLLSALDPDNSRMRTEP